MPTRSAPTLFFVWTVWACLAGSAAAQDGATVRDLLLEVDAERERVLIRVDGAVEPRLDEIDARNVMVAFPGATLAPTAAALLSPPAQGTVVRVTAFDRARPDAPFEVRVVVQRRPGAPVRLVREDGGVALEFDAMPRPKPLPAPTLSLANRNMPVMRLVTEVARAIGETVVFDDAVAGLGTVTIEGPGKVSHEEARALVDTILLLKGFARVPAPAGTSKIVPISGSPSPWVPGGALEDSDAPATTLLRLETVVASEMETLLAPYLGSHAMAVAFEPSNSLILAGPQSQLRRLREVLLALDRIESGVPVFWSLRNADVEVTAAQVQEVLGEREVPMAIGDARTNMLLLRVHPRSLAAARELVDRLDAPDRGSGDLNVVPLRYADPASLAEQLLALRDAAPREDDDPSGRRSGLRGLDFHVVADAASRSLVVRASPETFDAIHDTIRALDRQPPSVRLQVLVATLSYDDRLDLGADAFIPTLTNPKSPDDLIVAVTSNPSGGGIPVAPSANRPFVASFVRSPLLVNVVGPGGVPLVLEIPREQFSVSLNGRIVESDTLLRPELLVVSGEEHEVFAGDNIPVPVASTSEVEGDTFGQVRQNIERYDVGTSVRVTPTVGDQGGVTLDMLVSVSRLEPSQAGPVDEVGPSIREIEVETTVRLRHGEVAVIASDDEPVVTRRETGVPWLKDIPILGWAFRVTTDQTMKRVLLVSVQAEILRPEAQELARALADALGPLRPGSRTLRTEER